MKKLILGLSILGLFAVLMINSYLNNNEDSSNEVIAVKAEPIQSELHKEVKTVEPTPQPTQDPIEAALQDVERRMSEIKSIEDEMEWFIAYKEIVNDYYGVLDPPETIFDYFSEEEVRLICRVVETETFDQDFMSKVNVANVVLNRYYSGEFGETITEIVTSHNQFAYGRKNITEDTILAVMYSFEICDTTNGALYFHSNDKTDSFCGADYIFSDECGHHFFK